MSNETKWTPGHWQAFVPIDGDRWTVASHNGPLVADCGISENRYSGHNARLIAAAPELYDVIEGLLQFPNAEYMHDAARAALSKARGES